MFKNSTAFSSFSVNDLEKAKRFYSEILGLPVAEQPEGLGVTLANGAKVFLYPKKDHVPATFTVLNFTVPNLEQTTSELKKKNIPLEHYENPKTDVDGIARIDDQHHMAWFKDPAGNILGAMQDAEKKH